MPARLLMEPWLVKHGKKMAGFLEKPTTLFVMLCDLGINIRDQISPPNSLFRRWGDHQRQRICVVQHKANPMSSAPPPPPTALPVVGTVMAATTRATVTAVGAATTTTAVGAATATAVDVDATY